MRGFDIEESGAFARALTAAASRWNLSAADELFDLFVAELVDIAADRPPVIVSVDVFDTLLLRNNKCEARRYWEISELIRRVSDDCTNVDTRDLFLARDLAMRAGYRCGESIGECREGQILHVIATQLELLGLPPSLRAAFLESELQYEAQNLAGNDFLLRAIETAFGQIPIVGISDMYLSAGHIESLIDRVFEGRCSPKAVYSSADIILNKRSGRAYRAVAEQLACDVAHIVHLGDNLQADVLQARAAGVRALLFPITDVERLERHRDLELFVEERRREGLDCAAYASL